MNIEELNKDEFTEKINSIIPIPKKLYYRGDIENLKLPSIAIIGSRSCSEQGLRIARNMAKSLSKAGFCIISGMAKGIDGAAHSGCLQAGGRTIAVMRKRFWAHIPKRKPRIIS
ncbi:MAG: DNA-processing protein DprA [Clostridia bacterium]|nr:DNA-processing protein DprA [Clostridia bacterium]